MRGYVRFRNSEEGQEYLYIRSDSMLHSGPGSLSVQMHKNFLCQGRAQYHTAFNLLGCSLWKHIKLRAR